jgi:DGQHR domain-containing protein
MASRIVKFPGIRAKMGEKGNELIYYILKMPVSDLRKELDRVDVVHAQDNKQLATMIQRSWKDNRSKGQIATYLAEAHKFGDRFLGSFVIASFGSKPRFEKAKFAADSEVFEDSFGLIVFDGTQKYFILDGQHRLESLKYLYSNDPKRTQEPPPGLDEDEISVLLISNESSDDKDDFRSKLRRIFTALNRHAKATSTVENISIDEDDIAAIGARRLLNDIELFKHSGADKDNPTVNTEGQQSKERDQYLTTIATIYAINVIFLENITCRVEGCPAFSKKHLRTAKEDFFKFAHPEAVVEAHYEELKTLWIGLVDSIKEWTTKNPAKMKNHKPLEEREKNGGEMDHLLFWPVGQKGLARFLAQKINEADEPITKQLVKSKLKHLSKINWDMFAGPWYGFVLRQRPKKPLRGREKLDKVELTFAIHNQGAAEHNIADMLAFLHGDLFLEKKLEDNYKEEWDQSLILWQPQKEQIEKMWKETLKTRDTILKASK